MGAVATALRLNTYEREYLGNLVHPPAPSPAPDTEVRPDLLRLMASIPDVPAHVSGRYGDLLAWNPMTALLLFDPSTFEPPRCTWPHVIFLHEPFRRLLDDADWERLARQDIASICPEMRGQERKRATVTSEPGTQVPGSGPETPPKRHRGFSDRT